MTVVNPKSISGITSITTASGSDNLLTIHTSDASNTERLRIDSTGATKIVTGIVTTLTATTGIVTTLTANTITSVDSTESNSATTGAVKIAGGLGVVKNIYTSGAAYVQGSGGLTVTHDVSISDKIIHTDDTNTAIRFPAADTVSVETGGTERLRINSSGQLLSGVTGNAGASDANAVFGGGGAAGSSSHGKIYITNSSSNPTENSAIGFVGFSNQDLNNIPFAFMGVYADADHGSNDYPSRFAFWTTSDGSNSATERLRISSTGKTYFIGNSSGGFNATSLPNGNTVNINTKVSNDGISVIRYSGSYAAYALNIGRSKSDTLGTNSLVADGDDLGHIIWYGADGSDFNQAAAITAQVHGTPSDGTDMPGRLIFKVSADGSGTPTERLRIISNGVLQVNTTVTPGGNPSGGGAANSGGFLHLMAANSENAMSIINATSIPNSDAKGTVLSGINFINRNYYGSSGRAGTGYVVRSEKGHSSYMDRCQLRLIPGYDGNTLYSDRSVIFDFDGHILPGQDNNANLGGGSYRWDTVYAANSNINTSDETLKQDITTLTAAEMNAAKRLSKLFVTYKWKKSVSKKGDKARIHTGMIAQRIKEALEAEGLTAANYSFWCENITWKDSEGNVAGDGRTTGPGVYDELTDTTPSTDGYTKSVDYAVRYTELLSFISAYNEQRFTSIESRLDAAGL